MNMPKGFRGHPKQRQKQLLSEPVWNDMRVRTRTFRRLKFHGSPEDDFDTILTKLMDVIDNIRRKDNVSRPKQWLRESSEYHSYLQKES